MDKKNLLNEIVKARESIKRKHLALKLGKDAMQNVLKERLKPIIDTLEMIANTPAPPPVLPALDFSNNTTLAFQTPRKFSRNTFHSAIGEDTSFNGAIRSSPKPGSPNSVEN